MDRRAENQRRAVPLDSVWVIEDKTSKPEAGRRAFKFIPSTKRLLLALFVGTVLGNRTGQARSAAYTVLLSAR